MEDLSPQIAAVSWDEEHAGTVRFAEFLEMPGVAPGMAARVTLEDRGSTAELVDERTIKVNLAFRARAVVSEERTLALVRDCALVPIPEKPRTGSFLPGPAGRYPLEHCPAVPDDNGSPLPGQQPERVRRRGAAREETPDPEDAPYRITGSTG